MDADVRAAHERRLRHLQQTSARLGEEAPPEIPLEIAYLQELVRQVPVQKQLFTNIWFAQRRYRFWEYRDQDVGTLELHPQQAIYTGRKWHCRMIDIASVQHTSMGGSLNNNWVQVQYIDAGKEVSAYFAHAKTLGIAEIVGGSEALFQALHNLYERTRAKELPL